MRIRHLVCIGAVLVLTACGSSRSDEPAAKKTTATASAAPLSEADATKALLTIEDFPEGWTVEPEDDSEADVKVTKGSEACKVLADGPDDEAPTKVTSSFTRTDEASLDSTIESYAGSQAKKEWDADLKVITACRSFTLADASGEFSIGLTVQPAPVSELGDDAAAFHATGTVQGVTMNLELLSVRAGQNVVVITATAFGDRAPQDALEQKMQKVLDRLDEVDDAA